MAMRIEVISAWPRRHHAVVVELSAGATVADALAASGMALEGITGYAVFGERVGAQSPLRDGDRVELLRGLITDPKDARRRRAVRGDR
jgi:putative ubiquitin-RnfH superfamily antitoxin RatB of RatAB toxin-antitoxin module